MMYFDWVALFLDQISTINCFMCNPGSITLKQTVFE